MMVGRRVGRAFYGILALVAVATYLVHEAAHWIVGSALGYPVSYGINSVVSGVPMTATDHVLMSAAGPAVTVAIALIAFAMVVRRQSLTAYGILYVALFMRLVAVGVSVFNPNDEARISQLLGWGTWTLPAVVVIVLLVPTVIASRMLRLSWRVNVLSYVVCSIVAVLVVGLDMVLRGTI